MKKRIRQISTILSILILFAAAALALSTHFSLPGGMKAFSVLSGSMEPEIPTKSMIFSRIPRGKDDIQIGTIITFEKPDMKGINITHRVVEIKEKRSETIYITKGDANESPDKWEVPYSNIRGIYARNIPYLGYSLQFLQSKLGIILLVVLPVLYLVWQEIRTIISILVDREVKERLGESKKISPPRSQIQLGLITLLCLSISQIPSVYAAFKTDDVSFGTMTVSTTNASTSFPTYTTSPSPTPTSTSSTTPNGHLVINEIFFAVDPPHGIECPPPDNSIDNENEAKINNNIEVVQNTDDDETNNPNETINIKNGDATIALTINNEANNNDGKCDEWIELYNATEEPIDLKDWELADDSGVARTFNQHCIIPPHTFVLVPKSHKTFARYWSLPAGSKVAELGYHIGNGLGDSGDRLLLLNPDSALVDALSWGADTTTPHFSVALIAGQSISRSTPGTDTDTGTDFTLLATPTPGQ